VKRLAVVQSCYIPWKGYFDLINSVDEFLLYDNAQFTRRDWRSRNRIKTAQGTHWLTVPVLVRGRYHQRIDETVVADPAWAKRHWKTISHAYAAAPHFRDCAPVFERVYGELEGEPLLSRINRRLLETVMEVLRIHTPLRWSTEYPTEGTKTGRLVALCRAAGASEYVSGPSASAYLEKDLFEDAGIALSYIDYTGYPEYPQLHGAFEHEVTILDLLFNTGSAAPRYMKSFVSAAA
jgi:hypothetical protein